MMKIAVASSLPQFQASEHCDDCEVRKEISGTAVDGCERFVSVVLVSGQEVKLAQPKRIRVGMLKADLQKRLGIKRDEMKLMHGLRVLNDHELLPASVGSSLDLPSQINPDAGERLTLVRTSNLPAFLERQNLDSVNALGSGGATALHLAALRDLSSHCLEILADDDFTLINQTDFLGYTALHHAADRQLENVCADILSREDFTELNAQNRNGRTVLHIAARRGLGRTCTAILEHASASKFAVQDATGQTAIDLAESNGYAHIAEALRTHLQAAPIADDAT